jgi:hypothetical protein
MPPKALEIDGEFVVVFFRGLLQHGCEYRFLFIVVTQKGV